MAADSGQVPARAGRAYFMNGRQCQASDLGQSQDGPLLPRGREVCGADLVPSASDAKAASSTRPWFEDLVGTTKSGEKRRLVLFDGKCRLCLGFVGIVVSRDTDGIFCFAPLQSDLGQEVLAYHGFDKDLDSVVLYRDGKAFIRSSAALEILSEVEGMLKALYGFIWLPRGIRDWGYELVAKSRYSILGNTTVSKAANEAMLARMVDTWEPDPNDPLHECSS